MLKYLALAALGAAIVAPAFAQQPAAPPAPPPGAGGASAFGVQPAPAPAEDAEGRGGRGGGRGGAGRGPGAPGAEGFQGRGGGRGPGQPGAEGRGGRGPQPAAIATPVPAGAATLTKAPTQPIVAPPPPAPLGPTLPGTVVKAPPGFFSGMSVTTKTGDLLGRIALPPSDGAAVVVQIIDGTRRLVPTSELTIQNSQAVTELSEKALKGLPRPG